MLLSELGRWSALNKGVIYQMNGESQHGISSAFAPTEGTVTFGLKVGEVWWQCAAEATM